MPNPTLATAPKETTLPKIATGHLDAIVVPTVRSSDHLAYAIQLTRELDSYIVVLFSGSAYATEVRTRLAEAGVRGMIVAMPAAYSHPSLTFATDLFPEALYGRKANDISLKRNIGLLLARMVGWNKILFLDDDLTNLTGMEEALATDDVIAGFLVTDFPDNSVVRHAERLSGVEPGIALSGGALVVTAPKAVSFFPNIYNEDWLYMCDASAHTAPPRKVGSAIQQPYNPFSSPERAMSEEFGDLLAEGIVQLQDSGVTYADATLSDWRALIERRKVLTESIRTRLLVSKATDEARTRAALDSLEASAIRLAATTPESCVSYIATWQQDSDAWRERVSRLPKAVPLQAAIRLLELGDRTS
jgi:hypothetical protein